LGLRLLRVCPDAYFPKCVQPPPLPRTEPICPVLSDFLGKLPKGLSFRVTSGYRSEAVNKAVGGASGSQHRTGLAVDIHPYSWDGKPFNNEDLATWLHRKRWRYPELDQVILYEDTGHVHIGICPSGATGCVRGAPRGEFRKGKKGGPYPLWKPTKTLFHWYLLASGVGTLAVGGLLYYFREDLL